MTTVWKDVYKREIGALSNQAFSNRLAYSQDLVLRLKVSRRLVKQEVRMSAVSFNAGGDTLVIGTSQRELVIWDWENGNAILTFPSEHHNRINHAKFMPFADDRSIVTCAADGQVRRAQILEGGIVDSELLTKHRGKVHDLAIEPGSPNVLYTCGEDGMVHRIDLRRRRAAEVFDQSLKLNFPLTAIAIDPRNPNLFAIGGLDYPFAQLYDVRKCNWNRPNGTHQLVDAFHPAHISDRGILGLAFSDESELLVSYANESMYLFSKDMGTRPASAALSRDGVAEGPTVFRGHANFDSGYGMKFLGPKSAYVMSGSICGRIFIWKKKSGELIRVLDTNTYEVNCIEAHPHMAVVASGTERGLMVWTPTATEKAVMPTYDYKDPNFAFGGLQPHYFAFLRRYGTAMDDDDSIEGDDSDIA